MNISSDDLKNLFTKPYGCEAPSQKMWSRFYSKDVIFIDPTQEKHGLKAYIKAQDKLLKRCDDVSLKTFIVTTTDLYGFVEWEMGLIISGKEFVYPGITRLIFDESGKIKEHRDYFDFCGPTFSPVPILGNFIRWLYSRFVS